MPSSPAATSPTTTAATTSSSSSTKSAAPSTAARSPLVLIRPRSSLQPRLPFGLRYVERIINPEHVAEPGRLRIRILFQAARIALVLRQAEVSAVVDRGCRLEVVWDGQVDLVLFDPCERFVDQLGVLVGWFCAGSVEFGIAEEERLVEGEGSGDC